MVWPLLNEIEKEGVNSGKLDTQGLGLHTLVVDHKTCEPVFSSRLSIFAENRLRGF